MSDKRQEALSDFFSAAISARNVMDLEAALSALVAEVGGRLVYVPVGGRENNRGIIEVATDPGRCLIERVTNAFDAVLEREHVAHNGRPDCMSPRDAAQAWLSVPANGLSDLTQVQRRHLAQRVLVTVENGDETSDSRLVSVRDHGIGISAEEMPGTILSLNESNKIKKRYLAGTYGQGGSSTFAVSKYTLIASKKIGSAQVGFTFVKFLDLPAEDFKTGHYVYAQLDGAIMTLEVPDNEFEPGTLVKHFGFDLSHYSGAFDPGSVYGLLNRYLFDPVTSLTLQNRVAGWNRTIKGSRNSLNGARDDGDDARGPSIAYKMPLHMLSLGDLGSIGLEYWLLEHSDTNKNPIRAYVDHNRPIIITNNGQNQGDITQRLIKKDVGYAYLAGRLICHINCDTLTADAKRRLFTSTREQTRSGIVYDKIVEQLVLSLRGDQELERLNNEARERSLQSQDSENETQIRREVSRLLKIPGASNVSESTETTKSKAGTTGGTGGGSGGGGTTKLQPIVINDPPTFVRIVWDPQKPITFYRNQRRFIRIETDANSDLHDATDPKRSRFNFIVGSHLAVAGSTPLRGGRMRLIVDCKDEVAIGETGTVSVELSRPGAPVLTDQRSYAIIDKPEEKNNRERMKVPDFRIIPVPGKDHENWQIFPETLSEDKIASAAVMDGGILNIYYSTVFPNYASEYKAFEAKGINLANHFKRRYEIWLAVHSLLHYQDQQKEDAAQKLEKLSDDDQEAVEQDERVRIATVATLVAKREVSFGAAGDEDTI